MNGVFFLISEDWLRVCILVRFSSVSDLELTGPMLKQQSSPGTSLSIGYPIASGWPRDHTYKEHAIDCESYMYVFWGKTHMHTHMYV